MAADHESAFPRDFQFSDGSRALEAGLTKFEYTAIEMMKALTITQWGRTQSRFAANEIPGAYQTMSEQAKAEGMSLAQWIDHEQAKRAIEMAEALEDEVRKARGW